MAIDTRFAPYAPLAGLLAALLASCGGDIPDPDRLIDDLPVLTPVEDFRIGDAEDPDEGFTRIDALAEGPDGLIYLVEGGAQEIRVYDGAGRRLRRFGRRGQGPGEFTSAFALGFLGDTLWVNDYGQARFTLMSLEGEVHRTLPVPAVMFEVQDGVRSRWYPKWLRADGLVAAEHTWLMRGGDFVPPLSFTTPRIVFDREGRVADTTTIETFFPWRPPGERITVGAEKTWAPGPPPDMPLRMHLPNGAYLIERYAAATETDGVITVTRTSDSGDTLYHRSLPYLPRPLDPAIMEATLGRSARTLSSRQGLDSAGVHRLLRDALVEAPFQTPVSQAVVGVDGSLWLRREDDTGPTFRWLVLDPEGLPVGQLDLPRGVTILLATSDRAYASVPDELDVPWLVRYWIGD